MIEIAAKRGPKQKASGIERIPRTIEATASPERRGPRCTDDGGDGGDGGLGPAGSVLKYWLINYDKTLYIMEPVGD